MVQNQLVDYISSQIKAGVSQDVIKSTLVGAGWQVADVDDTMKKITTDMKPATAPMTAVASPAVSVAAKPMTTAAGSSMMSASKPASSMASADIMGGVNPAKSAEPVRVNPASPASSAGNKFPFTTGMAKTDKPSSFGSMNSAMSGNSSPKIASSPVMKSSGNGKMGMIVETVVVVLLVGLSVYLYLSNSSLSAKVNSLTSQTGSSASQVSSLTNQVSALTQQTSNLTSQVASLSASDTDLATNLAFFVVPANATATMAGSVNGTVQGFAGAYSFLTDQGVKLVVKNSADPNVIAVLNPIVGKTAQITGTFAPGTKLFTVSALNGMPVGETAAATTGAPATTTGTVASSTLAK